MRAHGTYVRYVQGPDSHDIPGRGCRCADCRRANRDYERERKARTVPSYVGADRARQHVRYLAENGIGLKSIARISSVSHGALSKLMHGERGRGLSKRIRHETEQAILAIQPDDGPGGTRIPAGPTWEIIEELLARGWTKTAIAHAIGQRGPGLQLKRTVVMRRNARAVRALLDEPVPPRRSRWGVANVPDDYLDEDDEAPPDPPSIVHFDLTPLPEGIDLSWRADGACRRPEYPTWLFFPGRGDVKTLEAARAVCARCPVIEPCLEFALATGAQGVWAGTSERERDLMSGRRQPSEVA